MVPLENGGHRWRPENREQRTENREQSARQARDGEIVGVWGGAPPRKPSLQASKLPSFQLPLHPRHVYDAPSRRPQEIQEMQEIQERPCGGGAAGPPRRTENGEQRTERAGPKGQTFHGHRERSAPVGDKEIAEQRNQTSKPLSFQTSNCPCTPGTSATRHQDDHRRFRRCRRYRRYRSARQAGDRRNRFSGNDRSARDGHVSEGRRAER